MSLLNTYRDRAAYIKHPVKETFVPPTGRSRLILPLSTYVWALEDGGHLQNGVLWVRIMTTEQVGTIPKNSTGVVPLSCLEFGAYRDEVRILVGHQFDQQVVVSRRGSLLQQTLEALYRGMSADFARLKEVGYDAGLLAKLAKDPADLAVRVVNCKFH